MRAAVVASVLISVAGGWTGIAEAREPVFVKDPQESDMMDEAPEDEPKRVRNGFSVKNDAGFGYRNLWGHAITGFATELAIGAQFSDVGALHYQMDLFLGETDHGLDTYSIAFGPSWEFIIGRFRPGVFLQCDYTNIERVTMNSSMDELSLSLGGTLALDIVQSPHANLYVDARGRATFYDQVTMPGFSIALGGRFKVP